MNKAWKDVTAQELESLYGTMSCKEIATRFQVPVERVRYRLKKHGITKVKAFYRQIYQENEGLMQQLNEQAKGRLLAQEGNIDRFAKAITHYAFRNGPVEAMHGDGKLTQEDMKTLNKYMVDRLSGLLVKVMEGEWLQIELLLAYYHSFGLDWDKAQADTLEFDQQWQNFRSKLMGED